MHRAVGGSVPCTEACIGHVGALHLIHRPCGGSVPCTETCIGHVGALYLVQVHAQGMCDLYRDMHRA